MASDLISKKTRYEFREYFVGTTLREIEAEFDAADVPCDSSYVPPETGQRRGLVEQYYHAVDWTKWSAVSRIVRVYENVLASLEERSKRARLAWEAEDSNEWARRRFESLKKWIERDGFSYRDGRLEPVGKGVDLASISDAATKFDIPELKRQIDRMRAAVEDDPGLAIGTAKELVETTCKTILTERGITFDDDADLPKLVKEARKALGLVPEGIPFAARGADAIQRILSSLGTVSGGLAELRNLYGTGHGKHGKAKGLTPRHARLAAGTAAALSMFLLETHEERGL